MFEIPVSDGQNLGYKSGLIVIFTGLASSRLDKKGLITALGGINVIYPIF